MAYLEWVSPAFSMSDSGSGRWGSGRVEAAYLASVCLFLLDRQYSVLGIRKEWRGKRFDLVARDRWKNDRVVLVEAKYRSDRKVRPSEVERFRGRLEEVAPGDDASYYIGVFVTNTDFSQKSLRLARKYGFKTFSNVPLLFTVRDR